MDAKDRYNTELGKIEADKSEFLNYLISELGNRIALTDQARARFISRIPEFRERYKKLGEAVQKDPELKEDYKGDMRVYENHINDCFDSIFASISLSDPNLLDSTKIYELRLMEGGMSPQDLEHVLEDYHETFNGLIALENKKLIVPPIGVQEKQEYQDMAAAINVGLSQLATNLFGIKIYSKLNTDLREQQPHSFLDWANIGYSRSMPDLVAVIAHEGPLGHQTNNSLSNGYMSNNNEFTLTKEGLAILGQKIALKHKFGKPGDCIDIAEYSMLKRRALDAFGAAFEKLFFYDKLSVEEIAQKLENGYMNRERLMQMFSGYETKGNLRIIGKNNSTNYYVGFNKINKIYEKVMGLIESNTAMDDQTKLAYKRNAMCKLYTGFRRPERMDEELMLFLKQKNITNGQGTATPPVPAPVNF